MILICPNCQTRFKLPEGKEIEGQRVSCCQCHHVWEVEQKDLMAQAPIMPIIKTDIFEKEEPEDLPEGPLPEPEQPIKKSRMRFFLAFFLGLGITLAIGGLFVLRSQPEPQGIDADLSLSLSPLELKKTELSQTMIVRGHIQNKTDSLYRLPEVNIIMLDKSYKILQQKKRLPPIRLLGPKRDVPFEYHFDSPPEGIYKIEVNFEVAEETEE
ncbi:MAG: hypothetical protein JXR30_03330 [Alphaproteobacteria bacterium]|nr:hypothetical protein [Alphaproteobacteria bacterium]